LDISLKQPISLNQLSKLQLLQKWATEKSNFQQQQLGKTRVLYATVTEAKLTNYDEIAQHCYQSVHPTGNNKTIG